MSWSSRRRRIQSSRQIDPSSSYGSDRQCRVNHHHRLVLLSGTCSIEHTLITGRWGAFVYTKGHLSKTQVHVKVICVHRRLLMLKINGKPVIGFKISDLLLLSSSQPREKEGGSGGSRQTHQTIKGRTLSGVFRRAGNAFFWHTVFCFWIELGGDKLSVDTALFKRLGLDLRVWGVGMCSIQ